MQVKPTMRCYCIKIKMAKIDKTDNTKCWKRCGTTGTPTLLVRSKRVKSF